MELQFLSSSPILITTLVFLILIFKITKKPNKITKLPPGPWKLPIIGNLHQLPGSLPHHRITELSKKHGPLMHLQIGEVSTVVVSSAEYAEQVMKTHDIKFATRPYIAAAHVLSYNSSDIAFGKYSEYWRQLRKICTLELLSVKRVTSFKSIREEEVSKLVEWIGSQAESGTTIDLTEKIYALANNVICRAAFGKLDRDQEKYLEVLEEAVVLESGFSAADLFPSMEGFLMWVTGMKVKLEKLHRRTDEMLSNIIEQRKRDRNDVRDEKDEVLLDVLLKIEENSDEGFKFTSTNVKAIIWDIIGGGSETSATVMDWAISELIKSPKIMKKVQSEVREVFDKFGKIDETCLNEMKYLKAVVKEILRLHPPLPFLLPRECRETCEVNGFEIPEKTRILINAWGIGRDSKYFFEPEKFIPERFLESNSHIDYKGNNFEYLSFGAGRRIYPGISFGVINVEFPLAMLLYYFNWKLPHGITCEDIDMTEEFGLSTRRKNHTWLVPISHQP